MDMLKEKVTEKVKSKPPKEKDHTDDEDSDTDLEDIVMQINESQKVEDPAAAEVLPPKGVTVVVPESEHKVSCVCVCVACVCVCVCVCVFVCFNFVCTASVSR